jgi:hypothetical protein
VLKAVKANAQCLGTRIGYRTDIDILLEGAFSHQLHGFLADLIERVGKVYIQDAAASFQTLVVLFEAEDVSLLLFGVPVTTDAFEDSGAIVDAVGHYPYLGFFQRDNLILKKGV